MATNEATVIAAQLERRHYDVFNWVSPSSEFIAANDITEYFMVYLRAVDGWSARHDEKGGNGQRPNDDDDDDSNDGKDVMKRFSEEEEDQLVVAGSGEVETLFVTLQMMHMDQPTTPLIQSSHTRGSDHKLDEWIIFPIAVCDVPLDAVVDCRVYSRNGLLGCTTFHPFTARGELKTGPWRYHLHAGGATSPRKPETQRWELLARDLRQGLLQPVPWMDKLVEQRVAEAYECDGETISSALPALSLVFPLTSSRLPVFLLSAPQVAVTSANSSNSIGSSNTTATNAMQPIPLAAAMPTRPHVDMCLRDENLCEATASALSRSLFLISNANAQPGPVERRQLQEIVRRPLIQLEGLKVANEMLLWRFRFFLSRDPAYFVPFMRCVNWNSKVERQEALKVMQQWKLINFAQALVCLSFYFREVVHVRNYAIALLDRQSDERILRFLLQLVQGVRHDVKGELEQFLVRRALSSWELCSTLFWYVLVEASLEKPLGAERQPQPHGLVQGRYSIFLQHLEAAVGEARPYFLQRIIRQQKLMGVLRCLYQTITKDPLDRLKRMELAMSLIEMKKCGIQELFQAVMCSAAEGACAVTLPTHPCIVVESLASSGFYMFKSAKMPIRVPLVVSQDCIIVDSDDNSFRHPFAHDDTCAPPAPATATSTSTGGVRPSFVPLALPSAELEVIFKLGDDVRQDQLVVQLVQLIDTMLRQDGLDLCLSPYRVLATARTEGLVELVPGVVTLLSVQRDITRYIRSHNPSEEAYKHAMSRFTKSFAGYSVITFILGIGDRHLENILLAQDGRLLHIDFGYILGNDPKPFPPPMKINKEMVEALGGPQSEGYTEFKSYCCSSYNIIRKHASLILSMLLLMVDASIPQISGDGKLDPRFNLMKVQEKLRLDLSNAQAAQYIQNVIADSVGSIFANLWDVIHVAAQATRH